jgi:hypothetical protein
MSSHVWSLLDLHQALQLQESIVADCLQQVLHDGNGRKSSGFVSAVAPNLMLR